MVCMSFSCHRIWHKYIFFFYLGMNKSLCIWLVTLIWMPAHFYEWVWLRTKWMTTQFLFFFCLLRGIYCMACPLPQVSDVENDNLAVYWNCKITVLSPLSLKALYHDGIVPYCIIESPLPHHTHTLSHTHNNMALLSYGLQSTAINCLVCMT